jgi:hypothetical protein
VLVLVVHVDPSRPGGVPSSCERAHERGVLDEGIDVELLAGGEVDAHVDEQLGVAREFLGVHIGMPIRREAGAGRKLRFRRIFERKS